MTDLEIVQEARKVVEERIKNYKFALSDYKKKSGAGYKWTVTTLNSWLAHKALFERHYGKHKETYDFMGEVVKLSRKPQCVICKNNYPCPELVAQAKAIMGVTE